MNHMLIKWSIFLLILHATFTNIYADNNNEDFRPIPGVHGKIAKIIYGSSFLSYIYPWNI